MSQYTFTVIMQNQFGVLNRLTSLFRRKQFYISSIAATETEHKDYSKITFCYEGSEEHKQHLIDQLYKLPDVCSITELTRDH